MKIFVQVKELHSLAERLHIKIEQLKDMHSFWSSVGEYMVKRTIKGCFDREQAPDGTKWKPLSPARVRQRMKRHKSGSMRILQDTGELRRSVRYKSSETSAVIGSKLKYAATHQFGRGNIPARPFLGFTREDKQHVLSMLAIYLRRASLNGG